MGQGQGPIFAHAQDGVIFFDTRSAEIRVHLHTLRFNSLMKQLFVLNNFTWGRGFISLLVENSIFLRVGLCYLPWGEGFYFACDRGIFLGVGAFYFPCVR